MYSIIYLSIIIVFFLIIYISVNYITVLIFNKGKPDFVLKEKSDYRLAENYIYGIKGNNEEEEQNTGELNCTTDTDELIECDIDENNELGKNAKCSQCKQISARCVNIKENVYSSVDPSVIVIKPNTSADKGYCLPSSTVTNSCTRRNGGKWILTKTQDTDVALENNTLDEKNIIYTFKCFCSTPNFFQNDVLSGNDCTKFIGCRHGKLLDENWSSYENMKCSCPEDFYESTMGSANIPPTCRPLNVYRRKYENGTAPFEILDKRFIDPEYLIILGNNSSNINIPNPCTFDITTKTFIKNIGRVVFNRVKQVAYCESTNPNYKTVILNDDYLWGNAGKYANAMFRFRTYDIDESNDDMDDNYNRYDNGIMYEVLRKGSEATTLSGSRLPYSNFPIYLPYLEKSSYNMGNSTGKDYRLFPVIPKNRQKYAMVYVYDAITPNYKIDIILGNTLQYIPTFMSISSDTRYRVYNGAIPCVNVADVSAVGINHVYRMMYPTPPANKFKSKLGTQGIYGDQVYPNENSDEYVSTYGFSFIYNNELEPYTELFTGILFSYSINNKIYTRPVSSGEKFLTNEYRRNFDINWRGRRPNVLGKSNDTLYQFAVTGRDGHMFTRNSYGVETNEIGTTKQKISRYIATDDRIKFQAFYS